MDIIIRICMYVMFFIQYLAILDAFKLLTQSRHASKQHFGLWCEEGIGGDFRDASINVPGLLNKDIAFALGMEKKGDAVRTDGEREVAYSDDNIRLKGEKMNGFGVTLPKGVDLNMNEQELAVLRRKEEAEQKLVDEDEPPKSDLELLKEELRRMAQKWEM